VLSRPIINRLPINQILLHVYQHFHLIRQMLDHQSRKSIQVRHKLLRIMFSYAKLHLREIVLEVIEFEQEGFVLHNILVHYPRNAGRVFDKREGEDFFCVVVLLD
jgi:hypothetical protein